MHRYTQLRQPSGTSKDGHLKGEKRNKKKVKKRRKESSNHLSIAVSRLQSDDTFVFQLLPSVSFLLSFTGFNKKQKLMTGTYRSSDFGIRDPVLHIQINTAVFPPTTVPQNGQPRGDDSLSGGQAVINGEARAALSASGRSVIRAPQSDHARIAPVSVNPRDAYEWVSFRLRLYPADTPRADRPDGIVSHSSVVSTRASSVEGCQMGHEVLLLANEQLLANELFKPAMPVNYWLCRYWLRHYPQLLANELLKMTIICGQTGAGCHQLMKYCFYSLNLQLFERIRGTIYSWHHQQLDTISQRTQI
ncbi:hypothetical protein CEXT_48341 [Caerostris extrusa]|uniref:Uncharacterized protein n=1 Tax=Caerostris extrusa TaxID=172846 RepID=A0AAV4N2U6_CAEEX|nr:hypothetical protein CEXT_48341 [Caerostris extrusa]